MLTNPIKPNLPSTPPPRPTTFMDYPLPQHSEYRPALRGVAVWVLVDQEPPMYEGDDGAFCDDWPSEGIWLEGEEQDESRAVDYDADPPR